jgi:hypothetical protein
VRLRRFQIINREKPGKSWVAGASSLRGWHFAAAKRAQRAGLKIFQSAIGEERFA